MHAVPQTDDRQCRLHVPAALRLRQAGEEQRQLDVLEGGEHGDEVVHLKHESHMARAPGRQLPGRHSGDLVAAHGDDAGRGQIQPAQEVQQRGLAGPAGAHEANELARVHVQIQALEHMNLLAAPLILLIESPHPDQAALIPAPVDPDHSGLPQPFILTRWPSRSPSSPLTTTCSPSDRPASTSCSLPRASPRRTARRSTRPSRYTNTTCPPPSSRTATRGTRILAAPVAPVAGASPKNVTFTPMSGRIRGSRRSKVTLTFTVAFCRSAVGITVRTVAGICQSGYASSLAVTGCAGLTRAI